MRASYIIGAIVVAVGVILAIQFWPFGDEPPAAPETPAAPAPAVPEPDEPVAVEAQTDDEAIPPPAPAVVLPSLASSDEFVLREISAWPIPEMWLQREDLLSRLAVVIQNAAEGAVPRRQLAFLAPSGGYAVLQQGDRFFVDPEAYQRYDGYLDVLEAVPPAEMAEFLRLVQPLLQEALALLGDRRPVQDLVAAAADRIDALPQLTGPVELLQPKVMYTYADPALEKLPEFDKQLLRMGPENLVRLRAYLAAFKASYPTR